MPFAKDEADTLIQHFESGELDHIQEALSKTSMRYGSKSEIERVGAYFEEHQEDIDKTSLAPIMRLLDVHKKAAELKVNGNALLNWALKQRDVSLLKLLVRQYGVDVEAPQDEQGNTMLHLAVKLGSRVAARRLIRLGWAKIDSRDKQGNTPLFKAIEEGNVRMVKFLVLMGADVNAVNHEGNTPLHAAAKKGSLKIVELLIKKKAQVNAKNKAGTSPLYFAAGGAPVEVLRFLIKQGAEVHAQNKKGYTPFHAAAAKGQVEILDMLKEYKADVNAQGAHGDTALYLAAQFRQTAAVDWLVNEGKADITARNHNNSLPLHIAAEKGDEKSVACLIQAAKVKGAFDIDTPGEYGNSALLWAARCGHLALVKSLVQDHKANVNAKSENGDTALHLAALYGHTAVVEWLVSKEGEADVTARNHNNSLPLHLAAEKGDEKSVACLIQAAKVKGAFDIDTPGQYGNSALLWAARCGHLALVTSLVRDHEANPNLKNQSGDTALHLAALYGHTAVVEWLVSKEGKADVTARNHNNSLPLHCAAEKGDEKAVACLIQAAKVKGAFDIDTPGEYGNSALLWAARCGHLALVKSLVQDHQANVNAKSENGDTALHLAALYGHTAVVEWLVSKEGKADVTARNHNSSLPLHCAAEKGDEKSVARLIEAAEAKEGKNFRIDTPNGYGSSALLVAANFGHLGVMQYLGTKGASWDTTSNQKNTALHLAAMRGHVSVVKYLVNEREANVEARNQYGRSPLCVAALNGQLDVVKFLIEEGGASVDAQNSKGNAALHYAVMGGHLPVVQYLVNECDVNVDVKNFLAKRPIHYAAEQGHTEVLKFLIQNKADIFERDNDKILDAAADEDERSDNRKSSPMEYACENDRDEAMKLLLKAGAGGGEFDHYVIEKSSEMYKWCVDFIEQGARAYSEKREAGAGYARAQLVRDEFHRAISPLPTVLQDIVQAYMGPVMEEEPRSIIQPAPELAMHDGMPQQVPAVFIQNNMLHFAAPPIPGHVPVVPAGQEVGEALDDEMLDAPAEPDNQALQEESDVYSDVADEGGSPPRGAFVPVSDSESDMADEDDPPPAVPLVPAPVAMPNPAQPIADPVVEEKYYRLVEDAKHLPSQIVLVEQALRGMAKEIDNARLREGETREARILRFDTSATKMIATLQSVELRAECNAYWLELKKTFLAMPKAVTPKDRANIVASLEKIDRPSQLPSAPVVAVSSTSVPETNPVVAVPAEANVPVASVVMPDFASGWWWKDADAAPSVKRKREEEEPAAEASSSARAEQDEPVQAAASQKKPKKKHASAWQAGLVTKMGMFGGFEVRPRMVKRKFEEEDHEARVVKSGKQVSVK